MRSSLRLPLVERGPNALEIVERNGQPLAPGQRWRWMVEMSRDVRRGERLDLPRRLILEMANTCNLDCPMCRIGRYGVNPDRFMPRTLFDEIADELFPRIGEVRLNGLGEATLVPWFEHCVRRVREAKLQGELITALTCPTDTIDRLVEAGFVLLVSWDAATPRLYELLRRPARFEDQLRRLRHLGRRAADATRSADIHLLFTLQRANVNELAGVVDLAADCSIPNVVVNVVKLRSEAWVTSGREGIRMALDAARARSIARGVRLFVPSHIGDLVVSHPDALPSSADGCDRPWREVVIRWNGDITVCNMFNPFSYGHWRRHGIEAAWNSPMAHAFRRLVNTPDRHPYCVGCHYIEGVYGRRVAGAGT